MSRYKVALKEAPVSYDIADDPLFFLEEQERFRHNLEVALARRVPTHREIIEEAIRRKYEQI